jgi:hypothetical protein
VNGGAVISLAVAYLLGVTALQIGAAEAPRPAVALLGEAGETFLRTAEIVKLEEYETKGITNPLRATLTDGDLTLRAVFKDVDNLDVRWKTADGRIFFNVTDCYTNEIASYELDKLLELGMVPPTVERRIGRDVGSLQFWVEGAMTEWDRKRVAKLSPPDMEAWNDQISTIKLYLQLIWDTDFNNMSNVMVDTNYWKIWKIDASRAFHNRAELRNEDSITRFSKRFLAALEYLDRDVLDEKLGPWLSRRQIKALWQRRDRILELAEERVAEFGESVLYD